MLTKGLVDFEPFDRYGRELKHSINREETNFKEYILLANYFTQNKKV